MAKITILQGTETGDLVAHRAGCSDIKRAVSRELARVFMGMEDMDAADARLALDVLIDNGRLTDQPVFAPCVKADPVAAKPRTAAERIDGTCGCGCGETPKGKRSVFIPGHDARWHAAHKKAAPVTEAKETKIQRVLKDPARIRAGRALGPTDA